MASNWSIGSRWMQWDPHLHAPGTLRNNQFGDDWEGYLTELERRKPAALGITDYFTLRSYEKVLEQQRQGRLADILIFPNIEVRLTIETRRGAGINLHLLVSPDDHDHVTLMKEKLARLEFRFAGSPYPCTDDGLVRLGRAHKGESGYPADAARKEGANQFKVTLDDLRSLREKDEWIRDNVLFAVAAGADGLSGIGSDSSFSAQRQELGRFADIIFSGSPGDRNYWSGDHADFKANGQRPKPCLHGCDAHKLARVLAPAEDRRCWIRAEPTFDGLRQTLVEPTRRVHIGAVAPNGPHPGNVIRRVTLRNADWAGTPSMELNDGLVTIIGPKGSGKTALADLAAFGAYAGDDEPGPASFIAKAAPLLQGVEIELEWGDGATDRVVFPADGTRAEEPRVRYLSQQFVERLCAAQGVSEPLVEEIESVVFAAIPDERRFQCGDFAELRELRLRGVLSQRKADAETIREHTKKIADDRRAHGQVGVLRGKVQEAARARKSFDDTIKAIPASANEALVKQHQEASAKLNSLREGIANAEREAMLRQNLSNEIDRELSIATRSLEERQQKYGDLLTPDDWNLLLFRPDDAAKPMLERVLRMDQDRVKALREKGLTGGAEVTDPEATAPQIAGLDALIAEEKRLANALGMDKTKARRRARLVSRLISAKKAEEQEQKKLTHAEGASARMATSNVARLEAYERLFAALVEEQAILERLYAPLCSQLNEDQKLSFFVQRSVNLDAWADAGERLLDLRRPPFAQRGALANVARSDLLSAWQSGSPKEVRAAIDAFISNHATQAVNALATGATASQFGDWLFSTDHIRVEYGINYEGVPISHLSPGTRGVVLLTLYLDLDRWDERPLIIDQPEENLDPKSVYADLVPFFREAAKRRQIIMVTHNANLVVNTDSDQVIVTSSERTSPDSLPTITYAAGGLESPDIRDKVCALLEGGEEAFRKRGRRYGMQK